MITKLGCRILHGPLLMVMHVVFLYKINNTTSCTIKLFSLSVKLEDFFLANKKEKVNEIIKKIVKRFRLKKSQPYSIQVN